MLKQVITCILSLFLLTGCWDKVEIDKRIFVTAIGIDKVKKGSTENPNDKFKITYHYPNTGVIAKQTEGDPRFSITATGENFYAVQRNVNSRWSGNITYDHLKLIVLGEELARDEKLMRELLDALERIPEMGRRIYIVITPGTIEDVMAVELPQQPVLGLFIRDMMSRGGVLVKAARTVDSDLGYMLRTLHESKATIAPRIKASKDGVNLAGAAVFKDYKLLGWMEEVEAKMMMYMLDKVSDAILNIPMENLDLAVIIRQSKTHMKVYEKEGKLYTQFDIEAEGALMQHYFGAVGNTFESEYLKKIEKKVESILEKEIKHTYSLMQKDFGADLIQAGEYLRKHEPELWDRVKDDWEEVFKTIEAQVNVKMHIRRIGVTR